MPEPTGAAAPALPTLLTTERLRLILVSAADAADMRAGRHQARWHPQYPRRDDVDAAALVKEGADPATASWGPRHVVLGHLAVGSIGCFGPPQDGEAEVGFGLVEDARRQGLAAEALRALAAAADQVGVRLRASVAPGSSPSMRVLATCGFTELRGRTEDDELVMGRPTPRGAGS